MLCDECTYLANTVLSSYNATESACDLAVLLSDRKNRSILWAYTEAAALEAILGILAEIPAPTFLPLDSMYTQNNTNVDDIHDDFSLFLSQDSTSSAKSQEGRYSNNSMDNDDPQSPSGWSPASQERRRRTKSSRKRRRGPSPRHRGVRSLDAAGLEALAAMVHFLSWDCTLSAHSASPSPEQARKVRRAILQDKRALRGVARLAWKDGAVRDRLGKTVGIEQQSMVGRESQDSFNKENEGGMDFGFSNTNGNDKKKEDSVESPFQDPTKSGRRRRKKRRTAYGSQMDNESQANEVDSPPQDTASEGGADMRNARSKTKLSFSSTETSHDDQPGNGTSNSGGAATAAPTDDGIGRNVGKSAQIRRAVMETTGTVLQGDDNDDDDGDDNHDKEQIEKRMLSSSKLALDGLDRIVQGKYGEEQSCLEGDDGANNNSSNNSNRKNSNDRTNTKDMDSDEEKAGEESNPLIQTNNLLLQSEVLPIFARATAETTLSLQLIGDEASDETTPEYFLERLSSLGSLIDGACCLSANNREALCSDGILILAILRVLRTFQASDMSKNVGTTATTESVLAAKRLTDVTLTLIRLLTSLTHENEIAARQMMMSFTGMVGMNGQDNDNANSSVDSDDDNDSLRLTGVDILMMILYKLATQPTGLKGTQHHYDIVILCLNTLTNVIDGPGVKKSLSTFQVEQQQSSSLSSRRKPKKGSTTREQKFLEWMVSWLVEQTSSFREGLLHGTFGEKTESQQQRELSVELEKGAQENLIMAGNGFVLLACMLAPMEDPEDDQLRFHIQERVLQQLPEANGKNRGGIVMVKNTLRAFCNFYHYSLGALSVAVVAPVKKLINQLDSIE